MPSLSAHARRVPSGENVGLVELDVSSGVSASSQRKAGAGRPRRTAAGRRAWACRRGRRRRPRAPRSASRRARRRRRSRSPTSTRRRRTTARALSSRRRARSSENVAPGLLRRHVLAQQQRAVADPRRRDLERLAGLLPGEVEAGRRRRRPERRRVAVDHLVVGDPGAVGGDPHVRRGLRGDILGRDRGGGRDRRAERDAVEGHPPQPAGLVGGDDRAVVGGGRPLVAALAAGQRRLAAAVGRHPPDVRPAPEHDRVRARRRRGGEQHEDDDEQGAHRCRRYPMRRVRVT